MQLTCQMPCSPAGSRLTDPCAGLQDLGPDITYVRISGYGQTGPKAQLAGYASVCEGYGGLRWAHCSWVAAGHGLASGALSALHAPGAGASQLVLGIECTVEGVVCGLTPAA